MNQNITITFLKLIIHQTNLKTSITAQIYSTFPRNPNLQTHPNSNHTYLQRDKNHNNHPKKQKKHIQIHFVYTPYNIPFLFSNNKIYKRTKPQANQKQPTLTFPKPIVHKTNLNTPIPAQISHYLPRKP